ncbi:CPBP family glutamic-type intramembrane protease [Tsuneonella sp. HG222]
MWKRFGTFVRRPQVPARVTGVRTATFPVLGKLFLLDLALMTGLICLALAAEAAGFQMPAHMLDALEFTPLLLLFILIGAPVGEELIFRSWLSGRPGHVGACLLVLLFAPLTAFAAGLGGPYAAVATGAAGLVLTLWLLWRKRGRPPMAFFARHFRWFYWGSALAFAGIHLSNFTEGNALFLLPLTLPQLLLGLILGYVRVHFGVWANTAFHAAHNSLFIGLVLWGMSSAS